MAWITEVPLAHRGLHGDGAPENSLAAFERAAASGVGIELDVHLSADRVPVVTHDEELTRVTGRAGRVRDLTALQLADHVLLGGDGAGIPMLADVLDVVAGRVPVMVELKSFERTVGPLERAVRDQVDGRGGVAVASFNPGTIDWFRVHAPGLPRGQTAASFRGANAMPRWLRPLLRTMMLNVRTRPHYVSYELDGLPNRWASSWRARGLPLVTWTVRSLDDLRRARDVADNVIFEGISVADAAG